MRFSNCLAHLGSSFGGPQRLRAFGMALGAGLLLVCRAADPTGDSPKVIFSTGFEPQEGYDKRYPLVGQGGWVSAGSGDYNWGNLLVSNFFAGMGQQALVGFDPPPAPKYDQLNAFRPLNLPSTQLSNRVVTFSTVMEIADSTGANRQYDAFRWSVYNAKGEFLFSLEFDNYTALVSYALNDERGFVATPYRFENDVDYDLTISMNFRRNLWSVSMNGATIVDAKTISANGAELSLGDIDAVWVVRQPGTPGDNYMFFDDFRVVAESVPSIPPSLQPKAYSPPAGFSLISHGEPGLSYVLEASLDLQHWMPISTNSLPVEGALMLTDQAAPQLPTRFYRTRTLTP